MSGEVDIVYYNPDDMDEGELSSKLIELKDSFKIGLFKTAAPEISDWHVYVTLKLDELERKIDSILVREDLNK